MKESYYNSTNSKAFKRDSNLYKTIESGEQIVQNV